MHRWMQRSILISTNPQTCRFQPVRREVVCFIGIIRSIYKCYNLRGGVKVDKSHVNHIIISILIRTRCFVSDILVVKADAGIDKFTKDGDSGALVTDVMKATDSPGTDYAAYAVHMSIDDDHEYEGDHFPASLAVRLDNCLKLLAKNCKINLSKGFVYKT